MFGVFIMVPLASVFYKAADIEDLPSPLFWGGGSAALWLLTDLLVPLGFFGSLAAQAALAVLMVIAIWRNNRHRYG